MSIRIQNNPKVMLTISYANHSKFRKLQSIVRIACLNTFSYVTADEMTTCYSVMNQYYGLPKPSKYLISINKHEK